MITSRDFRVGSLLIPRGSVGFVRIVDQTGGVAVRFDDPFPIGFGQTAQGYTFPAAVAGDFLLPLVVHSGRVA